MEPAATIEALMKLDLAAGVMRLNLIMSVGLIGKN